MMRARQGGMTLIEILVSLLILAIGMLGMAGLQTVGLRSTQSAYQRTQAAILGHDIVERLRANRQGVERGGYDHAVGSVTASCNSLSGCTPAQMAANDVAQWKQALAAALPEGEGTVCHDSSPDDGTPAAPACDGGGDLFAIKIWWDSDRDGTAENLFTMSSQP